MSESTPIVAFDQHAGTVVAAVLLPGQTEPSVATLAPDVAAVRRFVRRVRGTGPVRCCYEAGPCGFELQRALVRDGSACEVIAPALIPRRPGDRIKTDRRDARQLAVLYRAGALTAVHVPTDREEAVRDLVRCRGDIRTDLLRARHRLSTFLLRHDRRFPGTTQAWSRPHLTWVRQLPWAEPAAAETHRAYLRAVEETLARRATVDAELATCLTLEPLASRIGPLRCLRGIDDLTALTIACELSDPTRFPSARSVMAYVGLVPSEWSSGTRCRRGGITKTGNAHLRRVLIEAAWHYRHPPRVSATLRRRQAGQPAPIIAHAWEAQQRLHARYRRLQARGKSHPVVVTAVARELVGFVWAILTSRSDRPTASEAPSMAHCERR